MENLTPRADFAKSCVCCGACADFYGVVRWLDLFVATLIAFLIPSEYESTARLMPPDSQPSGGLALMAMLGSGQNGAPGLGTLASDLLGAKTTGAVFIAVMHSRTAEDRDYPAIRSEESVLDRDWRNQHESDWRKTPK